MSDANISPERIAEIEWHAKGYEGHCQAEHEVPELLAYIRQLEAEVDSVDNAFASGAEQGYKTGYVMGYEDCRIGKPPEIDPMAAKERGL